MHIGVINEAYFKDTGIPTHVRAYVKRLLAKGMRITVFATDVESKKESNLLELVRVRKTHHVFFKMYLFYRAIKDFHEHERIDLLHVHDSVAFIPCWFFSRIHKIPLVFTCHGSIYQGNAYQKYRTSDYSLKYVLLYKFTNKFFTLFSDYLIAVSNEVRDALIRTGAKENKIRVIPGLTDLKAQVEPRKFPRGRKTCLFVGAIRPVKGVDYLIKAIPGVLEKIKDIEFILIGPSEEKEKKKLLFLIRELSIDNYVHYLGFMPKDKLQDFYRRADLFILPSLSEAQGLVILEAMSFGLPVAASNVGGIPDMIKDSENGLLVNPGSPEELGGAIVKLSRNSELYERCSKGALESLSNNNNEKHVNELMQIYEMLLNRNRPMRIKHILLDLDHGGAQKVTVNLIKKMQGCMHSFSVCALDRLGGLRSELNGSVQVDCLDRKGLDLGLPFRLAKAIKSFKSDIVHIHNSTPLLYGAIGARLAGVRNIIVTQHGSITKEPRKMQFVLRQMLGMVNKTVAVSKDIEEYIKDTYKINGNKLELIINGIDEDAYKKVASRRVEIREKFGLKDSFVIGHVARLSPEKDQETLLKAFSKVAREIDNARLVIVGDGPLKNSLRFKVEGLKLQDKVLFLGSRNDIPELMNMFDIFVLSSVREGTSLTLLEAMATELPIVATNVGGNLDVVMDGESGLLVPSGNPDILAEKIVYLYKNPELRDKMGKIGRKRVVEEFSLSRMAKEYERIYRKI